MKRKAFKAQTKRVQGILDKWVQPLGLKWFVLDILYYDEGDEFPAGSTVVARTFADWRYRTAQIRVNVPLVAEQEDARLEHAMLHELMHILVQEMRANPGDGDHEERVVDGLASAFRWARDAAGVPQGV